VSDERLKIAVFIDFDNIEIGVKTTLGGYFDVGAVLEAIKERGEVVTKVAYGDWTRATDYGRSMSQHAIHMVQRNLTPGGDKNGADINLALDALEMAFTHNHINAFVIVGGDSDFITLVEKLKQYDRKVFVVGGRAFTSQVMQKNCTEFVAYEDIVGVTSRGGRHAGKGGRGSGEASLQAAMPLIRRALKLLADREVLPQLGLLKSTLLQLDSSFSERAYGASSFRDFVQKLAKAGFVVLKGTERSFHVELRETSEPAGVAPAAGAAPPPPPAPPQTPPPPPAAEGAEHTLTTGRTEAAEPGEISEPQAVDQTAEQQGDQPPRLGPVEGYQIIRAAFTRPGVSLRFPMYLRQVKQFVRQYDETFDERKYGYTGLVDALRYGQREGLFRLDRDRQGVVRVFPGVALQRPAGTEGDAAAVDAAPEHQPETTAPVQETPPVADTGHVAPDAVQPSEDAAAEPREDVETARELVDAVTYDVVTRVDADSGVIDVAPHGTDVPAHAAPPAETPRRPGARSRRASGTGKGGDKTGRPAASRQRTGSGKAHADGGGSRGRRRKPAKPSAE
jgi:uncharacterized LabA/DUF88 family protein